MTAEIEVPGCPEGSLKTVQFIQEKQPQTLVVKTTDPDCVNVLKLALPLFDYVIAEIKKTEKYYSVETRKK